MARIPYIDPASAPEAVREVFEQVPVELNIFKIMAHAETNFRPLLRLGTSISDLFGVFHRHAGQSWKRFSAH